MTTDAIQEMRILSVTQPRATLVAVGAKRIESRDWGTPYRGPLAIHAAKSLLPIGGVAGLRALVQQEPFRSALQHWGDAWGEDVLGDPAYFLPRGAIVAVCELVDCIPIRLVWDSMRPYFVVERTPTGTKWRVPPLELELEPERSFGGAMWRVPPPEPERSFGDYASGRYAWLLDTIRPLHQPLPYRGGQGLRRLPADVAADVLRRTA